MLPGSGSRRPPRWRPRRRCPRPSISRSATCSFATNAGRSTSAPPADQPVLRKFRRRSSRRRRHLPLLHRPGRRWSPPHSHRPVGVTVGTGRRRAAEDIHHLGFGRDPRGTPSPVHPGRRARKGARASRTIPLSGASDPSCVRNGLMIPAEAARYCGFRSTAAFKGCSAQRDIELASHAAESTRLPMSATDALVELVRAALRDPAVRADILELVSSAAPVNDTATEPLLDAVEAAKILGMTPPAVRAAAYRETLPCVRVGRLLRFRRSELLAATRR